MNLKALQPLPPPWGRARERGWKQPLATGRAVGTEEPNAPIGRALCFPCRSRPSLILTQHAVFEVVRVCDSRMSRMKR